MTIKALRELYAECEKDESFQHLRPSNFVPGNGKANSSIMLIGEAPGKVENIKRLPFQGDSGILLKQLIADSGLDLDLLYITNVLKFRPPNNRTPYEHEIISSIPYLKKEIAIVKPKVIVPLGKVPARAFFPSRDFSSLIGTTVETKKFIVKVLNHPAAMLHSTDKEYVEMINRMFIEAFTEIRRIIGNGDG